MIRPKGFVTRQAKRLSDGEINRRRFVMSALSAGVTMPTALSLASKAEALTPKSGGLLRMAVSDGTVHNGLNPTSASNGFLRLLAFARGNALTEITATGEVVGDLAEAVEPSGDALRWTITLRSGIQFHDGKDVTAEDVVASLERQRHLPAVASVADMRPLGTRQIVIDLTQSDPHFDQRLADPKLIILPSKAPVDTPIGTGPYVVERFEPGLSAHLVRNPNYWKPGRAHFDAVILSTIPDATDRQTALMMGEVDYADGIDPRGIALLDRSPTLVTLDAAGERHLVLDMRHDKAPFDDPDLRMALAHAIPADTLAERLVLGHGAPLDTGFAFDLEMARHYHRRSGQYGAVPLTHTADLKAREAAHLIAASASKAGIDVRPAELSGDAPGWLADIRRGDHIGAGSTWVPLRINNLSAHSTALSHSGQVGTNLENDGARLIERWWFA